MATDASIDAALNRLTTKLNETELKSLNRQIEQEGKSQMRKVVADAKQRS